MTYVKCYTVQEEIALQETKNQERNSVILMSY